jgi:AAA family ATP:ADP antiporter
MQRQTVFSIEFLKTNLWPIFPHEVRRVLTLSALLFLVCFDYSMLRCMKDTVVVTASSAAVIPFIKVWTLLPMAVFFTFGYAKISSRLSRSTTFYVIVTAFLAFFLVYAFVLYPYREAVHLTTLGNFLRGVLPLGLSGFIAMLEYWSFTLFYIIAELWSNIVLSILTWGFINEITTIKEAPRFYAVLSVASNVAAVAAGLVANIFVSNTFQNDWQTSQQCMILVIVASGFFSLLLYRLVSKDQAIRSQAELIPGEERGAIKFSLRESFQEVQKSRHLRYLAIIVIAYFFVINTVEVIWKEQLRLLFSSPSDFNHYMNTLTTWIGVVSTLLGVCVAFLISRFGWTKTALLTPVVSLVTSLAFFIFVTFENKLLGLSGLLGTTPLAIAVFLGAVQNCLSKGTKYSCFDSTKEMAFIPLSRVSKMKGKAVIDGVMSRSGKSGASLVLQSMILMFGGLVVSTPYIIGIMLAVIIGWIGATRRLGRIIDKALGSEEISPAPKPEQLELAPLAPASSEDHDALADESGLVMPCQPT